jgi:hypothetical protein
VFSIKWVLYRICSLHIPDVFKAEAPRKNRCPRHKTRENVFSIEFVLYSMCSLHKPDTFKAEEAKEGDTGAPDARENQESNSVHGHLALVQYRLV